MTNDDQSLLDTELEILAMRNAYLGLAAVVVLMLLASTVQADWWADICRDYHRNKNWPQPFVQVDRAQTLMPFAVMQNNGWERENLMGAHHFSADNTELSEAGRLKAQWILTQSPAQRRTLFVEYPGDPQKMAARMRALQTLSSKFLPPGMVADVRPSRMMTEGWPASVVDQTNTQFQESRPVPALPAVAASTEAQ
jgi:hypothetical protein